MKIRQSSGSRAVPCGRTEGTGMTKLSLFVIFRMSLIGSKNYVISAVKRRLTYVSILCILHLLSDHAGVPHITVSVIWNWPQLRNRPFFSNCLFVHFRSIYLFIKPNKYTKYHVRITVQTLLHLDPQGCIFMPKHVEVIHVRLLRTIVKLRQEALRFIMSGSTSVALSVFPHRTTRLKTGQIFMKNWYSGIFRNKKTVQKTQVTLKSNKNNGYITWRPRYNFYYISLIPS